LQGRILNWIAEILRTNPALPFGKVDQEFPAVIEGEHTKFNDVTLFDEEGKPALVFELKLPDRPDGISPRNGAVVALTQRKASAIGAPYFMTWNVNNAVLWQTFVPHKPVLQRSLETHPNIAAVRDSDQIDHRHVRDALKAFLAEFLPHFGDIYAGKRIPALQPLDEGFIHTLQTYLQPVVQILTSDLMRRYRRDKRFAKQLRDWAVQGQGWTWQERQRLPETLERTARLACNILVNKIVFYEAMRKAYPGFSILAVPTAINTGPELRELLARHFERIRADIDYETVFTEEFIDTIPFIADALVEPWRQMIANVEAYDFAHLPYDVIGTIFQRLIAPDERHKLGQYFTPANVVDLINAFCIRDPNASVLDPGCGAGTFLVRAYSRIKYLDPDKSHDDLLNALWGIDIARYPAHLAVLNLAVRDLSPDGNYPNIVHKDFFEVFPQQTLLPFHRRTYAAVGRTSEEFKRPVPLMDAVVGNPPYTRQEEMEDLYPGLKERAHDALYHDWKIEISKRASIYAHFFIHGAAFLKEGGYLGLLTSNSWLDVDYGKHLQEFFLNNFKIVAILEPKLERWFPDAAVNTDITILQRCSDSVQDPEIVGSGKEERDNNLVKFVQIKVPLAQLIPQTADEEARQKALDSLVQEIEAVTHHVDNDLWRIYPISQKELLQEGIDQGRYVGAKWGKYLRAPDVFFQILERGKDKLCRLSDVAEVRRGFTTGANDFFYVKDITDTLSDAELKQLYGLTRKKTEKIRVVQAGDGSTHLIEAEYLKPVIFSLKELSSPDVAAATLQYQFLHCCKPLNQLRGTKVFQYIKRGESFGYHLRPTCRSRRVWYCLAEGWLPADLIFPSKVGERWVIAINDGTLEDKKQYGITAKSSHLVMPLAAILNSTVTRLYIEQTCRQLTGAQAIADIDVVVVERALIVDPRKIEKGLLKELCSVWDQLRKRPGLSVFDEVAQPDRRHLDDLVLQAVGFSRSDDRKRVLDALYSAIVDFVRARLEKADSVIGVEEKRRRASAEAIAEVLLQEFDPDMAKSFPKDFTPKKYVHTVIALPAGADDFERLTMNRLRVAEKLLEFDEPDQALFVYYALQSGARESVHLPTHEPTLQKAVRQYTQYLDDLDKHLTDLAASRTRDRKLKARIKDALRQKLSLPGAPERQMKLL